MKNDIDHKGLPLSMPFWCVGNQGADPFGKAIMHLLSSMEICEILCRAKKDGLIDFTAAHDDDLVRWDPLNPEDDLDPTSDTSKTLRALKNMLNVAGLQFHMITCNLHGNDVFRNGGLTNPNPEIRLLAARKVMRAIRIGNFLGATHYTYWVARDGYESQFAVDWKHVFGYLRDGLNLVQTYAKELGGSICGGTIEAKPNEPRGAMFLQSTGHALAFIFQLADPSFWGVNPEILQHEAMTLLSPTNSIAMAAAFGKLPFLHLGNQVAGQFDNDNPVLCGMDGLKETVACFWALAQLGWKGIVEFDNHMLRTDMLPEKASKTRYAFIKLNVQNFRLVELLVLRLQNIKIQEAQNMLWNQNPNLAAQLADGIPADLLQISLRYQEANDTPVTIGQLDQLVSYTLLNP